MHQRPPPGYTSERGEERSRRVAGAGPGIGPRKCKPDTDRRAAPVKKNAGTATQGPRYSANFTIFALFMPLYRATHMTQDNYRFETLQVHAGQTPDSDTRARAVPIYQTTSYVFESAEQGAKLFALQEAGNIYTRITNPTTAVLEERIARLEGGAAALAVASGHSAQLVAISTFMRQGDNFVSSPFLYGGTYNQFRHSLANFGIGCRFAASLDPAAIEPLIDGQTKAVYIESISNPNFAVPDFEAIAAVAHRHGIPLIVDNTFGAAGYLCRPLDHGADIVVESATKWIGGHGTTMGGVIVDSGRFDWNSGRFPMVSEPSESYHGLNFCEAFGPLAFIMKARGEALRDLGPAIAPISSFMLLQGVETLSLRVEREAQNALELARYFRSHPKVERVCYPGLEDDPSHANALRYLHNGFGCVLSVVLRGTKLDAATFIGQLRLVSHLANVGDTKTLIIQPSATTHAQLPDEALEAIGIEPTMLRISVGIEHIDDLKADFDNAFSAIP